jgi:hypothetical protein
LQLETKINFVDGRLGKKEKQTSISDFVSSARLFFIDVYIQPTQFCLREESVFTSYFY